MQIAPKSIVARVLAALWLLLCLGVLVFGFVQRDIHDMPVAFVWFLIFLSFPIGLAVVFAFGLVTTTLGEFAAILYVPFWSELPLWLAAVVAGYFQWFVLLPAAARFAVNARGRR
jgi:hypothetical protein